MFMMKALIWNIFRKMPLWMLLLILAMVSALLIRQFSPGWLANYLMA